MEHAYEDDALSCKKGSELRGVAWFCMVCSAVMNDEDSL